MWRGNGCAGRSMSSISVCVGRGRSVLTVEWGHFDVFAWFLIGVVCEERDQVVVFLLVSSLSANMSACRDWTHLETNSPHFPVPVSVLPLHKYGRFVEDSSDVMLEILWEGRTTNCVRICTHVKVLSNELRGQGQPKIEVPNEIPTRCRTSRTTKQRTSATTSSASLV